MKILLIGKSGQLGHELYLQLKTEHVLFAPSSGILNIVDKDKVRKYMKQIKPDLVINASAFHVVKECENFPDKAFDVNSVAIKNLADICEENNSMFIHFSTDYVFDGKKGSAYLENDQPNPLQVYGITKLSGEYFAKIYNKKSIIIRTSYLYGGKNGSRTKGGNFVLTILKQAKGKETLEVASNLIVTPTYSYDLALATIQLIQKKADPGVYHLVNEGMCSLADFSKEIIKNTKMKTRIIPVDRGNEDIKRPFLSALKNGKASRLGVKLPQWEDALKRYVASLTE